MPLRNFFVSVALTALAAGTLPAMAQVSSGSSSSTTSSSSVSSSASSMSSSSVSSSISSSSSSDVRSCIEVAVHTRTQAMTAARASLHAKVQAAITVRTSALVAASSIVDLGQRLAAIRAAWNVYFSATASAHAQFNADLRNASTAFINAMRNCHPMHPNLGLQLGGNSSAGLHLGF